MIRFSFVFFCTLLCISSCKEKTLSDLREQDEFRWLHSRSSKTVDRWVTKQNSKFDEEFTKTPSFKKTKRDVLKTLRNKKTLPDFKIIGNYIYSTFYPQTNSRGIWKRIEIDKFHPNLMRWEPVINFDKLGKDEKKEYSFSSITCLEPKENSCIISLSTSNGDTVELKQFNLQTKTFPKGGFSWKKGKTNVEWLGEDSLVISGSFGPQTTLSSGFGKQARLWNKGKLSKPIVNADPKDLGIFFSKFSDKQRKNVVVASQYFSEKRHQSWVLLGTKKYKLPFPQATWVSSMINGNLIAVVDQEWDEGGKIFKPGDVIGLNLDKLVSGEKKTDLFNLIFRPDQNQFPSDSIIATDNILAIEVIENAKAKVIFFSASAEKFKRISDINFGNSNIRIKGSHRTSDRIVLKKEGFLTPPEIFIFTPLKNEAKTLVKENSFFDTSQMKVEQHWVASKDGVQVPYYLVGKEGALVSPQSSVVLRGYGAYGFNYLPFYDPVFGSEWLAKGGVLALANVRGGGEFGDEWYSSSLGKTRYKSSQDLLAVARALTNKHRYSRRKLGAYSGSAGGLLIGTAMITDPTAFQSVCGVVPIFDILAGDILLGGVNWRGEFGDPDDSSDRASILRHSPYYNIKEGVNYPNFLAYSVRSDERAHPGHARKMVAKLQSLKNTNAFYLEKKDGGHKAAATLEQEAFWKTAVLEFFKKTLQLEGP